MAKENELGRPPDHLTIKAIPEGPMATPRRKWAAIAKFHSINEAREKRGFEVISDAVFLKHTMISKHDLSIADSQKEYVDVSMSLAKGNAALWFKTELPFMQREAQKLRDAGDGKKYLDVAMNIADMLQFKGFTLDGMEETEVRDATETVEEIMILLNDEAVKAALRNEDGLVPQKIIPALVGASFKSRGKEKTLATSRFSGAPEVDSPERPNSPMDSILQTGDRTQEPEEIHPIHGGEPDGEK